MAIVLLSVSDVVNDVVKTSTRIPVPSIVLVDFH